MWVRSHRQLAPTTATGMRNKWETRGSKVSTCTWPRGSRNMGSRVRRGMRMPMESSAEASLLEQMKQKLKTEAGRDLYRMRKAIVEPVFGQIKEWRGFRRFLLRGLQKVRAEWKLICLTHNLLKLFRSGRAWQMS